MILVAQAAALSLPYLAAPRLLMLATAAPAAVLCPRAPGPENSGPQPSNPNKNPDDPRFTYVSLEALKAVDDLADWAQLDLLYLPPLEPSTPRLGAPNTSAEALASYLGFLPQRLSRLLYLASPFPPSAGPETPHGSLLAQARATMHRPLGFASSPSLPGTISSPWWTDFAHLIYWFYFVATFTTVVFLWYLYDFRVRRAETAHPVRETRGFSRAQTGDLVTAVLPLTWSATMVMHASTHSINFDENTAGTAFSFTVVAYQWGWNYYFPRDVVTQLEAAPRVVGRGRLVSFETSPLEASPASHWDSWALRATIGGRHGSRSGRLNTSPALPLILPTDVPAGYVASLTTPPAGHWRRALAAALSDLGSAPFNPNPARPGQGLAQLPDLGLETPTLFRAKPSVFVSGSRLGLVYTHLAPTRRHPPLAPTAWVTTNLASLEGDDAQTRALRSLLPTPSAWALPGLDNVAGAVKAPLGLPRGGSKSLNLSHLRAPSKPAAQHLLWTGPEAVTGAGVTAIGSTEDHGWTSPVAAREAGLRSALAVRAAALLHLQLTMIPAGSGAPASAALLLPFDLSARQLLSHSSPLATPLPFTWAAASVALEAEIDGASIGLWATSLLPDQSSMALNQPASLVGKQATPAALRALLTPTAEALRAFYLAPLSPARPQALARLLPPSKLVCYLARPGLPLPSAPRGRLAPVADLRASAIPPLALRPTHPGIAFDWAGAPGASRRPALAALARTSVGLARAREALAAYVTALGTLDRRLASAAVGHSLARAAFNLALSNQNPLPSAPCRPALVALARSYLALTRAREARAAYLPALRALGLRPALNALDRRLASAVLGLSLASARLVLSNQRPLPCSPALGRDARLPAREALRLLPALDRRLAGAVLGLNLASARLALSNQNPLPAAPCRPALVDLARSYLALIRACDTSDYRHARPQSLEALCLCPGLRGTLDRRLASARLGLNLASARLTLVLRNQAAAPSGPALAALARAQHRYRLASNEALNVHWNYRLASKILDLPLIAPARARKARITYLSALTALDRRLSRALLARQLASARLTRALSQQKPRPSAHNLGGASAPCRPALVALAHPFVALTRAREARLPALQALAHPFIALTRAGEARAPLLPTLQALALSFVALTRAREVRAARLSALQALNFHLTRAILEHNLAGANFTRTLSKQTPWPLAGGVGFAQAWAPKAPCKPPFALAAYTALKAPGLHPATLAALGRAPAHPASTATLPPRLTSKVGAAELPPPRARLMPSPMGVGLDEGRLVRAGSSRLVDAAMLGTRLEGLSAPSLTPPATPLALLSLGWSTSTSLASYPSYKVARGGVFRRPFTGISTNLSPQGGLRDPLSPLNLGKGRAHLGLPLLTLATPLAPRFHAAAPSLDAQVGAWSQVWAVLTPAPTEDLDPTFINARWTPEVNTTRRGDHNSRYLVSWSPLLASLTTGAPMGPASGGPSARATQATSALRSSLLALNELGLKNSFGLRGTRPTLLQPGALGGGGSFALSAAPSASVLSAAATPRWVALWGALPCPTTNHFVGAATQLAPDQLSGRSTSLMARRGGLLGGSLSPAATHIGGAGRLNPLTDTLAKLEFSSLGNPGLETRPRQGYLPINSDIGVSRRLRVTKGVTLPSDTPMHVICGSKDVIHSWAIPGLNVKIDCVPGYNSHRRLLLRWRGAYWGQCMEVCGRYHHWMPIMVNVVHPALFVDWCLTFLRGLDSQSANGPSSLPPLDFEALVRAFR